MKKSRVDQVEELCDAILREGGKEERKELLMLILHYQPLKNLNILSTPARQPKEAGMGAAKRKHPTP